MAPTRGIGSLLIASISFGSAAIFIRFADQATAVSLTLYRLAIAAIVMILFALSTRSFKLPSRTDLLLMVLSGVVLSLHFAAYILAVKETTVANATFLVNTGPVMLVILSPIVIKERTTRREMWGVILATLGVLLVADAGNGFRTFGWPDLSALAAAFLLALYSLIGRQLRTSGITTGCYTSYVYSIAASVSLLLAWGVGAPISGSYDLQNLIAILGLALVPTVVGHSLYNYALGSVKAVTANLFPLLEPIIASLLAVQLFNEIPTPIQVIGYTLILSSVFIVVTRLE